MRRVTRISAALTLTCRLLSVPLMGLMAGSVGHSQTLQLPSDRPVSFTNVTTSKGDDPHAYGVGIELYKHGGTWTGFIWQFGGFVADPPVGKLDSLQLDEHTGTVVFTARLSLGLTYPQGAPTKDLFEFTGTIKQDTVSGKLVRRLVDDTARGSTSEMIILKREADKPYPKTTLYDDWIRTWELRMKVRGPK